MGGMTVGPCGFPHEAATFPPKKREGEEEGRKTLYFRIFRLFMRNRFFLFESSGYLFETHLYGVF